MILDELARETRTIVIHEAPHHLQKTLKEILEALGDRKISLCREMTKKYEDVFRTTLSEAVSFYEENEPRGEYVLVIEGKSRQEIEKEERDNWEQVAIDEHYQMYLEKGVDRKEAMKMVAKDRGISKREVYAFLQKLQMKN